MKHGDGSFASKTEEPSFFKIFLKKLLPNKHHHDNIKSVVTNGI